MLSIHVKWGSRRHTLLGRFTISSRVANSIFDAEVNVPKGIAAIGLKQGAAVIVNKLTSHHVVG